MPAGSDRGAADPRRAVVGACLRASIVAQGGAVWKQPYLETCCRAALHRLHLCGKAGRPSGLMDEPCQRRLAAMGLCCFDHDGRVIISLAGEDRHASEIMGRPPRHAVSPDLAATDDG